MKQSALKEANRIAGELIKWRDVHLRLRVGNNAFCIKFQAYDVKTISSTSYDLIIHDEKTLSTYKAFVEECIKQCEADLEAL